MSGDILFIRLINGEQIAARYVDEEIQEGYLKFVYPMLIEHKDAGGVSAINLVKYLPFNTEQVLILNKMHIVSMTNVTTSFAQYYYNSVHYSELFIQPQTDSNLLQINKTLEQHLSDDQQQFTSNIRKFAHRIPDNISTKFH